MAMVFISYAKEDSQIVDALEAALVDSKASVWRDKSQIPPGADHWRLIEREIEQAKAVVVCCSAASLNNKNVRKELGFAESREIPLLTVALEPPRSLRPPIELIGQSMEDLSHWRGDVLDPAFLKLLSAIGGAADDEELKRRYPDWVAEQRDQAEAQKRAADAQRAAEATERRMAAEAKAKAQADFNAAKAQFVSEQQALFWALPEARALAKFEQALSREISDLRRAESDLASHVEGSVMNQRRAGWFAVWTVLSLALVLVLGHSYDARVVQWFLLLPVGCGAIAWVLGGDPNGSEKAKQLRAARAHVAAAERDLRSAKAAADERWAPFQQAIDQFESGRPRD
jgi:hypothetical protein